jgi:hypothetical protein
MPILIRAKNSAQAISPQGFATESDLEMLLAGSPDLLRPDGSVALALVDGQVDLREAGILDLLFVSADGLPIAVEVKLARNAQARREVVAQAIDYLSSLTALTVDELDALVGGKLEAALRSFSDVDSASDFERRWQAVGANLRAGLARLVVALDDAPSGLERIFRFLARTSDLDVQLVTIQCYTAELGEVYVPRFLLSPASEDKPGALPGGRTSRPELSQVVSIYNPTAPFDLQAVGSGVNYRQIRPPDWPGSFRTHYEFYQTRTYIGAELHLEADAARPLGTLLAPFAGRPVANGGAYLVWDQNWSSGRGRLAARFPVATDPDIIATAMRDLIALTRIPATEKLRELAAKITPQMCE